MKNLIKYKWKYKKNPEESSTNAFDAKMICHTEKLLKLAETTPVNELYKSEALKFAMKCGAIYGSYIFYMAY